MKILNKQISLDFGEESTLLPEASPANRSALPESSRERMITDTSSRKCLDLFGRFSRVGSWQRMFAALLLNKGDWYSSRCALTWNLRATRYNRLYFQLVPSTLPIEETECGLLPTVQTQGLKEFKEGKRRFYPLSLLPTPNASEGKKYAKKYNPDSQMGTGLTALAMNGLLLTPSATDGLRANFSMESLKAHKKIKGDPLKSNLSEQIAHKVGGGNFRLNPRFVAEMMGFPPDWTVYPFLHGESKASRALETR